MNGYHLLQCCEIPDELSSERDTIMSKYHQHLNLETFAKRVVTGYGAHIRPNKQKHNQARSRHHSTESWRRSIVLGRKIAWAAKTALRSMLIESESTTPSFDQILQELFQEEFLPMEDAPTTDSIPPGVRINGGMTEGGLSSMLYALSQNVQL